MFNQILNTSHIEKLKAGLWAGALLLRRLRLLRTRRQRLLRYGGARPHFSCQTPSNGNPALQQRHWMHRSLTLTKQGSLTLCSATYGPHSATASSTAAAEGEGGGQTAVVVVAAESPLAEPALGLGNGDDHRGAQRAVESPRQQKPASPTTAPLQPRSRSCSCSVIVASSWEAPSAAGASGECPGCATAAPRLPASRRTARTPRDGMMIAWKAPNRRMFSLRQHAASPRQAPKRARVLRGACHSCPLSRPLMSRFHTLQRDRSTVGNGTYRGAQGRRRGHARSGTADRHFIHAAGGSMQMLSRRPACSLGPAPQKQRRQQAVPPQPSPQLPTPARPWPAAQAPAAPPAAAALAPRLLPPLVPAPTQPLCQQIHRRQARAPPRGLQAPPQARWRHPGKRRLRRRRQAQRASPA